MADQSGSSHLRVLFEAALRDYERQTDITLDKLPFAEQLQRCNSAESVTAILQNQVRACSEFRGIDRIMRPLNEFVSILCSLTASFDNPGPVSLRVLMTCSMHLMLIL